LNEIHEYEEKLAERLINGDKILVNAVNDYNDYDTLEYYSQFVPYLPSCPPPFPMVEIYMDIIVLYKCITGLVRRAGTYIAKHDYTNV
jgi:hypothetical protein